MAKWVRCSFQPCIDNQQCMRESCFISDIPGVEDILNRAIATFLERNAIYSSGYQRAGAALVALFPEGGVPPIRTPEDAARLRFIINCAAKLQRYCHAFADGGHVDSAEDLIVYAAMLREVTK